MMCLDLISPAALPRSRFLGDRYILRYDRYSEAVFRRTVPGEPPRHRWPRIELRWHRPHRERVSFHRSGIAQCGRRTDPRRSGHRHDLRSAHRIRTRDGTGSDAGRYPRNRPGRIGGQAVSRHSGSDAADDRRPGVCCRSVGQRPGARVLSGKLPRFRDLAECGRVVPATVRRLGAAPSSPALIHCTTGKDRTGWAAAALLLFLGASEDAVFADYLETNKILLPMFAPLLERFEAKGIDPTLLEGVLGVRREYLEASMAELAQVHGSIEPTSPTA